MLASSKVIARFNVAILAGSKKYSGAGYLSTLGALKGGAGLVTWCRNYKALSSPHEAMDYILPKEKSIVSFIKFTQDKDIVVIGPGLGLKFAEKVMNKVIGKIIYLHCPTGFAKTKLTNNLFERKLKSISTSRNWKTITKLVELSNESVE